MILHQADVPIVFFDGVFRFHFIKQKGGEVLQSCSPFIFLGMVAMTGIARSSSPSIPSPPATDQAQVVEAIKTMYVALTHDDLNQFRSVAASSFYAFDGGKRFSADALVAFIKGLHATGNVYVWNVTEPEVQVHGDIAWITYINRGSIQDASGVKGMTWLESAVLRKEQGAWLIQFFHSTRVP